MKLKRHHGYPQWNPGIQEVWGCPMVGKLASTEKERPTSSSKCIVITFMLFLIAEHKKFVWESILNLERMKYFSL